MIAGKSLYFEAVFDGSVCLEGDVVEAVFDSHLESDYLLAVFDSRLDSGSLMAGDSLVAVFDLKKVRTFPHDGHAEYQYV